MAILSRMFRLCKADLHGVMDQLEDRGLLLKQYVREMEESLAHKAGRQAQIDDGCRKIQNDLDLRRKELEKVEADLSLAVRKDKDEIAKMLIRKRWVLKNTNDQIGHQLQILEEEKGRVAELLASQRLQYDQLKVRADAFCRAAEQQGFEMDVPAGEGFPNWQAPSDEEVDLELLQRKEALRKGGAA